MSDYIDRTSAKNAVFFDKLAWNRICSIPVADAVERKRGKWEDVEVTDISGRTDLPLSSISSMRCSVCNRYHNEVYHYGIPTEMAHFCPYCGADMQGEKE